MLTQDEKNMKKAICQAKKASAIGEVPIGCVVVLDGKVISTGYNRRETKKNALLHAEITAIDRACKKLGSWRLCECELYVTLEPCPMCAGAIINSRMKRVVFGAPDPKAGAFGSVTDLNAFPFNHKCELVPCVLRNECGALLSDFFRALRDEKKKSGNTTPIDACKDGECGCADIEQYTQ